MQPEFITVVLQTLIIGLAVFVIAYPLTIMFGPQFAAWQETGRHRELKKQIEPAKHESPLLKADPSVLLLAGAILGITLLVTVGGILQIMSGG